MSREMARAADLRFATNEERRFALAYLRWLAGREHRRQREPPQPTTPTRSRRNAESRHGRTSREWFATRPSIWSNETSDPGPKATHAA
jgi:hypothetical protein